MKNLKYVLPFLIIYSFAFFPLFWPFQLIRLLPYGVMFYLLVICLKGTQLNKIIPYSIFWLGVFFDIAPFFSAVPFITTISMVMCFLIMIFSERANAIESSSMISEAGIHFQDQIK